MFTKDQTIIIDKAFEYAHKTHDGQLDDTGKPYIIHPVQVANILMCVTSDENIIAAAALHDTIEDTATTYEDLVREFGKDIADLVNEVSHEGKKDNGGYYFPRLETKRGIMIKFADRLSNISRMEAWDDKRVKQYLKKSKFWNSEPNK